MTAIYQNQQLLVLIDGSQLLYPACEFAIKNCSVAAISISSKMLYNKHIK